MLKEKKKQMLAFGTEVEQERDKKRDGENIELTERFTCLSNVKTVEHLV
jgi:hypothetical protein